jgi:hypothetical protein
VLEPPANLKELWIEYGLLKETTNSRKTATNKKRKMAKEMEMEEVCFWRGTISSPLTPTPDSTSTFIYSPHLQLANFFNKDSRA